MLLRRTLSARFGINVDVRMWLCPAAVFSMEESGADVGAVLAPPLARLTLLSVDSP